MSTTGVSVVFLFLLVLEPCVSTNTTSGPTTDQPATDLNWLKSQIDLLTETVYAEQEDLARLEGDLMQLRVDLRAEVSVERGQRMRIEEELEQLRKNSTAEISAERERGLHLAEELVQIGKELKADIAAVRHQSVRLEEDLKELFSNQTVHEKQIVAFSARVTSDLTDLHHNDVILFGTVITNLGHAYNETSGEFHCPISGLYQFSVAIQSRASQYVHTELLVNGKAHMYTYSAGDKETPGSLGSNTAIVELQKGDVVWVLKKSSNGNFVDGGFSTFSGHLIH